MDSNIHTYLVKEFYSTITSLWFRRHNIYLIYIDITDNCFDIKLTTKTMGSEIYWSLGTCLGSQGYTDHHTFLEKCCLYPGNYTLSCRNSPGGFLEIFGKRYCEGTSKEIINVGKFFITCEINRY